MNELALNWIPPIVTIGIIILLFLIARENSILNHYESGTKYQGFLQSVLFNIMQSGGNSFLFMPMLWFDFKGKEEFEIKHLKIRNMLTLILISVIIISVLVYLFTKA